MERSSHIQLADGSLVPIDEPCRQLLLLRLMEMSSKGLRCLGLAYKDDLGEFSDYYSQNHPAHKKLLDPGCYSSIESDLIFVGVVGLRVSYPSGLHQLTNHNINLTEETFIMNRTPHEMRFGKQLRTVEVLVLESW